MRRYFFLPELVDIVFDRQVCIKMSLYVKVS